VRVGLVLAVLLAAAPEGRAVPIAYRDINGVWHRVDTRDWPPVPSSRVHRLRTRGGVGFSVVYRDEVDNTGVGFDDPTLGVERRAVVAEVLQVLGGHIADSGSCEIEFEASETDGSGPLAEAGPLYLDGPPAFDPGPAFLHITTGTDPYNDAPDISATVDFGHAWFSGAGNVPAGQYDLRSVVLHELTHGLGFLSLSDSQGRSEISGANPGVYSTFDDFLFTGNGDDLFITSANGASFAGLSSDLRGGDGGVRFAGPNAMAALGSQPPIYAPNPFSNGSSLSHWNDSSFSPPRPVMVHAVFPGTQKRDYDAFELAALRDLGYTVGTPGPTPTATQTPVPGQVPAQGGAGGLGLLAAGLLAAAVAGALRRRRS
jgi:hypothetical protein